MMGPELVPDMAGEIAQCLRVLAALPEDWGLISSAHTVAHNQP